MKIRDMGEQGLLTILQGFCPADLIGDDGAIMAMEANKSLVVTTDILVDGVHFSEQTTSPADAGWRSVAANLSDLAAMGATPLGITVGLGIDPDMEVSWVKHLYEGMVSCLQPYQIPIVGGDLVRSSVTTISITAFGKVDENKAIRRKSGQPDQLIIATGYHGSSRAGLELLLNPEKGKNLNDFDRDYLIRSHQRPQPRLDVLPFLSEMLVNRDVAIAGMDSSDGLADAILQICRASGIGAKIDRQQIPIYHAVSEMVSGEKALEWALYGGEDFELVLCLPPDLAEILLSKIGIGAAIIGMTTKENHQINLVDSKGIYPDVPLTFSRGFQHFQVG